MWHRCAGSRVPRQATSDSGATPPLDTSVLHRSIQQSQLLYMSLGHSTFPQIKILTEVNLFGIHKKRKKKKKKIQIFGNYLGKLTWHILSVILQQQNHLLQQQNDFLQHQNHNLLESLQQMPRKNDYINGINLEERVKKEWERLRETHM